jgi:phosphatidylglycerophosphate synthase
MPRNGNPILARDLAFKSVEIEELADVYFFRPAGSLIARAARALGISPVGLTLAGALIGIIGGALLYDERLGLIAFALLIVHSIVDSADGQLARMTGRTSEMGRALDGLSGYATHAAIYLAIGAGLVHRGGSPLVIGSMLLAGMASAIHAGMYDYYRHVYVAVVTEGRLPGQASPKMPPPIGWLFGLYLLVQRWLTGSHTRVEAALLERSTEDRVSEEDRNRYRECFYSRVRGWNFLGDNTRFYAIGILACFHRLDLFFAFVLVPMNLAFLLLWLWQRQGDQKFLAGP